MGKLARPIKTNSNTIQSARLAHRTRHGQRHATFSKFRRDVGLPTIPIVNGQLHHATMSLAGQNSLPRHQLDDTIYLAELQSVVITAVSREEAGSTEADASAAD